VAAGAFGALLGSVTVSRHVATLRPARTMLLGCTAWLTAILVFANLPAPHLGIPMLIVCGFAQSISQVPMSAILLRNTEAQYRGRVMGIRMLAIYGNLPGLLLSGPLIVRFGYPATATLYCIFGIGVAVLIAMRWRAHLWKADAPGNLR
jgi:predicted MFS family arabinose efflux permease